MRSSGSVIGGAINFGNNHEDGAAGGVRWSTYVVFIVFGELGPVTGKQKLDAKKGLQSVPVYFSPFCSAPPRKCVEGTVRWFPRLRT